MSRQFHYIFKAVGLLVILAAAVLLVSQFIATGGEPAYTESFFIDPPTIESDNRVAYKGKRLFLNQCASCHNVFKDGTGPALGPVIESEQWKDRKKLYEFIRYPDKFFEKDPYVKNLYKAYEVKMTGFPDLSDEEIEEIVAYISTAGLSLRIYQNLPAEN